MCSCIGILCAYVAAGGRVPMAAYLERMVERISALPPLATRMVGIDQVPYHSKGTHAATMR